MKKIINYIKPYWLWTLIAPLFMLGEVVMDLLQPELMSSVINEGVIAGDKTYIIVTCLKMVGVAILGILGGCGNMFFSTKAGYAFARDLRSDLYTKVQSFSFANIDKFKTGSLVTRLTNDVTQIQNAFTSIIRMLVRSPLLFIGGVIQVFRISPRLALIVLAAMPLIGLMIGFVMKFGFPMFRVVQEKLDKTNVVMQENLAGVRVIKAFGRGAYERDRFSAANDDLMAINRKAQRIMSTSFPIVNLIMNFTLLAVYMSGGHMILDGAFGLETGDLMAFASYVTQILSSLTMSSFMLLHISRAKVSVDRVNEVLDTQVDIEGREGSKCKVEQGRVEFRNVSFRYPGQGGEPVLKNISFTAEPGSTVAILGSTGSGKSSLISLIPRLYDTTEGDVLVDGRSVRDYTLDNLRGGIGVALQESVLFTGSISENLRWGNEEATDEEIQQMAKIAQADDFILKTQDGYETGLGQRGVNLSGGQKQRMCIARALVKKPKILILDDSTSAVDLVTEAEIQKNLRDVMGHCTVFIIAQRISSVMDADKILVMDNGRIVDEGTHEELKERCDVYREIVVSQLGKEAA